LRSRTDTEKGGVTTTRAITGGRLLSTVAAAAVATMACTAPDPGHRVLEESTEAIRALRDGAYRYEYSGTGSVGGDFSGSAAFGKTSDGRLFFRASLSPSPTPLAPGVEPPDDGPPTLQIGSNGHDVAARDGATRRFSHGTYAGGSGHLATYAGYAMLFELSEEDPFAGELEGKVELVGRDTIGGIECDVVTATEPALGGADVTWYIGVDDRLPRARRWVSAPDGPGGEFFFRMSGLAVDTTFGPDALGVASEPDDEIIDEDARVVDVGAPAPPWRLSGLDGTPVSLADLRGDVVVLDLGASWCADCGALRTEIGRLARELADRPVRFYAVSTWESPDVDPAAYAARAGPEYLTLTRGEALVVPYKVKGLPALFVIGPDGRLVWLRNPVDGDATETAAALETAIRGALP